MRAALVALLRATMDERGWIGAPDFLDTCDDDELLDVARTLLAAEVI